MNGKIINIQPEHERILFFLYPDYSVEETLSKPEKFIIRRDITSPKEKNLLENFSNFIVVSSKLYDENYDREVLKSLALSFRHERFKTRRRTLNELDSLSDEEFIDALISFMFTDSYNIPSEEVVLPLFNSFGTSQFIVDFLNLSQSIPVAKIIASMFTFISKVMSDTGTVYYKKKNLSYGDKIKRNLPQCLDNFKLCFDDSFGLRYVKFFSDLTK